MANKIIVFTLDGCGHCTQLKEKMRENSIPFTEIPIQENKKIWDEVKNGTFNGFSIEGIFNYKPKMTQEEMMMAEIKKILQSVQF
jgi:glutaredoxin